MRKKREPVSDHPAFLERLHLVAERCGGVGALAKKSGVSETAIRNYLKAGEPTRAALNAIAKNSGVRVAWLACGEGPMEGDPAKGELFQLPQSPLDPFVVVRMVDIGAVLKDGSFSSGPPLVLPNGWLLALNRSPDFNPDDVRYWHVTDNSMQPEFGFGDYALLDTGTKTRAFLTSGHFLLTANRVFYLSRVWFVGGDRVEVTGAKRDNIIFARSRDDFDKEAKIVGRVFGKIASTL